MEIVWSLLLIVGCVTAYPSGAPPEACKDMFPSGHNADAETSDPPYTITTNATNYGMPVLVTLTALNNGYFEGVFIQARRAHCGPSHEIPVGTYSLQNSEAQDRLKLMDCGNGTARQNALTHSDKAKKKVLQFIWVPPSQDPGTVYFRGTFVKETTEFWTSVTSEFVSSPQGQSDNPMICNSGGLSLTPLPFTLSALFTLLVYSFTSTS